MEKFFSLPLFGLAIVGINLGHFQGWKRLIINVMLTFNPLIILILLSQIFGEVGKLPIFIDILASLPKYIAFLIYKDHIKRIMDSLNEIFDQMTKEEKSSFTKLTLSRRRIVSVLTFVHLQVIGVVFITFYALVAISYVKTGEFVKVIPKYVNWWPIDPQKYYLTAITLEIVMVFINSIRLIIQDIMYMLILILVMAEYQCLGEKFKTFINQAAETKNFDRKEFGKLIKIHQTLNGHVKTLNDVYGVPLLSFILSIAVIMCLTGYFMVTQDLPDVKTTNISFLAKALFHTFFLCWFGDRVAKEV